MELKIFQPERGKNCIFPPKKVHIRRFWSSSWEVCGNFKVLVFLGLARLGGEGGGPDTGDRQWDGTADTGSGSITYHKLAFSSQLQSQSSKHSILSLLWLPGSSLESWTHQPPDSWREPLGVHLPRQPWLGFKTIWNRTSPELNPITVIQVIKLIYYDYLLFPL